MKKIKQLLELLKALLSNKKTRAAIILAIYFVFFIFLGIAFRGSNKIKQKSNTIDNFNNITNYNFDMEINTDNNITLISGNKNALEENFILNNKKYNITNGVMYEVINNNKITSYNYDFYLD